MDSDGAAEDVNSTVFICDDIIARCQRISYKFIDFEARMRRIRELIRRQPDAQLTVEFNEMVQEWMDMCESLRQI